MLQINDRIRIPDSELSFSFAKSPGPGGQNVNKLNTKAILRWHLGNSKAIDDGIRDRFLRRFPTRLNLRGEVVIISHEERTQAGNQAACLERLRAMILQVLKPPKTRKPTKPSAGSRRRRLDSKRRTAEKKQTRERPGWND